MISSGRAYCFSLIGRYWISSSNSLLNPLAVKELFNTGGQSLVRGLAHLVDDLRHNDGLPRQVDERAFEVGVNLATTPGAVVFRNELLGARASLSRVNRKCTRARSSSSSELSSIHWRVCFCQAR